MKGIKVANEKLGNTKSASKKLQNDTNDRNLSITKKLFQV